MTQGTHWLTRHAGLVFLVGTFFVRESPAGCSAVAA